MSQASTVRPARLCRAPFRRLGLLATGAAVALLLGASAASAQQYGSVGSSVTVDYGVLDSLGSPGGPNLPGMLSTGQLQAAPYGGYPYAGPAYGGQGTLLQPPDSTPRSGLTAPGAAGTPPGGSGVITLIPPSEFKNKNRTVAAPAKPATPPPAPDPAPAPSQQATTEPAPPPPPAEIQPPAPPAQPTPPAAAAPAAPEPPAMAQVDPAPPPAAEAGQPEPSPQATAAPPPPPEPAAAAEPAPPEPPAAEPAAAQADELMPGGALSGEEGGVTAAEPGPSDVDEVPPAPEPQALAEAAQPAEQPLSEAPVPEAAAEAPAAAAPAAEDGQAAALPAPAMVEGQVSVTFAEGASELTAEGKQALDTVAERLRSDESLRVQLLAYAQAIDDNTSRARRMSLSRALAVRSYLIEKGVRSTRMDVRALGSNVEGEPADRVDVIPQGQ